MPTYVLPQVQVFQDFNLRPEAEIRPSNALITGGHAELFRCSEADEKALIGLGTYDHVGTNIDGVFKTCYTWPQKKSSSIIDTAYTKLCIDDALLRYWRDTSDTMLKTASNKIKHPTKNFITNPTAPLTYPRHADFQERDVTVGDTVSIIGSSDGGTTLFNLCTFVKDIEADQSASVVAAAVSDTDNPASQAASSSATAYTSNTGTVVAPTVSHAAYTGLHDGVITDVYTVEVTQASTGGDHTTARLQVTSASGKDDKSDVTPSAAASPTAIGDNGATATFAAGNFALGDKYTITVSQEFEKPVATSGGTYIGTTDKVYIIEVTKGGDYAVFPEITVTTADGTDFSGPHPLVDLWGSGTPTTSTTSTTNAPGACDTATISIGTLGVTVCFSGHGLRLGDRYTIAVTAPADTTFRTLVLGHELDALIPLNDAVNAALEVSLYIKKDIEVGEKHVRIGGNYNWDQTDTQFCARAGIEAFDETWTNAGVPEALPVIKDPLCASTNQMYVEFRAWNQDLSLAVNSIRDVANLDTAVTGPLHPDNPLKWALFKALSNNNNAEVKYISTSDPAASASWVTVLDKIEERDDVYGLVPLTYDKTVLDLFQAHVQSQSTETQGRWRVLWINLPDSSAKVIADATTATTTILATTEDDPDTAGTQYTILKAQTGQGYFADVRVNDTVRYQYTTDAWGDISYTEYVVAAVVNNDTLRLVTGTAAAENTPRKVEVHRVLTETEHAAELALTRGYTDRRVRATWPDKISSGGTEMDGIHLNAALAALSSGVVPQQGLTNLQITGFDDVGRTTKLFNRTQLDTMAGGGVWIVTQDPGDGEVFSRHAVTTGDTEDVSQREEQIVRNVDSISFYFLDVFAPYIGVSNVTPSMLEIIESEVLAGIQFLRTRGETPRLGGQLIDATITDLRQSIEFKDRIIVGLDLNIPGRPQRFGDSLACVTAAAPSYARGRASSGKDIPSTLVESNGGLGCRIFITGTPMLLVDHLQRTRVKSHSRSSSVGRARMLVS